VKWLFVIIAIIGFLAMFLGIVRIFISPYGYGIFTDNLFKFCKCDEKCTWAVILAGGFLAVFFGWLASRGQDGE
jgi:hypothetical protein